ncbi:hypothetical protein CDAR_43861 [Caerostris darwini]|uniref:Uncharacterized protein n=1 Tax=Caerostris darwini TaxID=1538125 RepID=A0AAV4WJ12_9ARAC|nr:hypothetical protein CDAR_43861 [Caerostris darwini]
MKVPNNPLAGHSLSRKEEVDFVIALPLHAAHVRHFRDITCHLHCLSSQETVWEVRKLCISPECLQWQRIHGEDDPLDLSINDHSKINHREGGAIRDSNSDSGLPSNGTLEGRTDEIMSQVGNFRVFAGAEGGHQREEAANFWVVEEPRFNCEERNLAQSPALITTHLRRG